MVDVSTSAKKTNSDAPDAATSITTVIAEVDALLSSLVESAPAGLNEAVELLESAPRIFVHGAGRSGLALRMTAMRLMHLGHEVHVVGEVTSPAIAEGDVLFTASGSGTTSSIVNAAQKSVDVGAKVVALTINPDSPLGKLATVIVPIPGAIKTDHSGSASVQYAGALFEQGVVVIGDSLFHTLWQRDTQPAEELWSRHANIE